MANMRSDEEIMSLWDNATKENPLDLTHHEWDRWTTLIRARNNSKMQSHTIIDKDKLLKNGVVSPADGKHYSNRSEWNEMLKRNNCVELGNDIKTPENRPISANDMRGDFNVRSALRSATREVLSKQGYN